MIMFESKLCMWQLVTGYNLREYEVKEQMRQQLEATADGDIDSDIDLDSVGES